MVGKEYSKKGLRKKQVLKNLLEIGKGLLFAIAMYTGLMVFIVIFISCLLILMIAGKYYPDHASNFIKIGYKFIWYTSIFMISVVILFIIKNCERIKE